MESLKGIIKVDLKWENVRSKLETFQKFMVEAIHTVACVLNRSPTTTLNQQTPFEPWHGSKP